MKGLSITAQISLFAALFLLEMAARKRSAIDREYIPDSDSESGFSLGSDSDIDVSVQRLWNWTLPWILLWTLSY